MQKTNKNSLRGTLSSNFEDSRANRRILNILSHLKAQDHSPEILWVISDCAFLYLHRKGGSVGSKSFSSFQDFSETILSYLKNKLEPYLKYAQLRTHSSPFFNASRAHFRRTRAKIVLTYPLHIELGWQIIWKLAQMPSKNEKIILSDAQMSEFAILIH